MLRRGLGPALLLLLVLWVGPAELWRSLRTLGPGAFVAANLGWWSIALVKSWRWRRTLAALDIALDGRVAARFYLGSLALGTVSPGRVGELAKVAFVKARGAPVVPALVATVYDRLLDVLVLPMVATAALWVHGANRPDELLPFAVVSVVALTGAVGLFSLRRWVAIPVGALVPKALGGASLVDEVIAALDALPWRLHLMLGGVTAACWALYAGSLWVLAQDLGIVAPPLVVAAAVLGAALAAALPLSVSGIGTRDAALVALLAPAGVSAPLALALSGATLALVSVQALSFWPAWRASVRENPEAAPGLGGGPAAR